MPCRDPELPHDTSSFMGTSGNVFERPPAREGRTSTFFNNSKDLAYTCQKLRLDVTGATKRSESEMRQESLNMSIPLPHIQNGGGMLHHTGGTCFHSGMIDYPRFPISELHLGTLRDSVEFQSWKVNFKTEVCSKSADSQLTMQWIKEVEIALLTSQSITGRKNVPDYDMLDAMIASALKKLLDKHIHFRTRVSVEEQRAEKYDRVSQIAYMICEHFRATGAF